MKKAKHVQQVLLTINERELKALLKLTDALLLSIEQEDLVEKHLQSVITFKDKLLVARESFRLTRRIQRIRKKKEKERATRK